MQTLKETLPQVGHITWIGRRPAKRMPLEAVEVAQLDTEGGLVGDHYSGSSGKRQLTLIQGEHLRGVAQMLHRDQVSPMETRRNVVVEGINLLALKDQRVQIGEAIIEVTGLCHPCSQMEEILGPGGYNAMRGHGGLTARIVQSGAIKVGDEVKLLIEEKA
jgi:MOSC domain-containing protein YiiM